VGWKQRVSVVVLAVFASLPVSGTLCAMMCDSAAAATSTHHGSDKQCEEATRPSTGGQLEGASEHDCGNHDAAVRQIASTVPERIELQAAATVFALSAGNSSFSSLPVSAPAIDDASPPGTPPRPSTSLVLRV
jgi:hypothetical protein